ncbi:MAG: carbamoyl-phosphate synthase large subunit [Phycisphaerae bacterium]|nr:carbamoyl-phosphate synthase large subunit [Phycisphaerae bacterium]
MEIKRFGLGLDSIDKWLPAEKAAELTRAAMAVADEGDASASSAAQRAPRIAGSRAGEAPADIVEAAATVWPIPEEVLRNKLSVPSQGRMYYARYAFKLGWSVEQVHEISQIDPWFLANIKELVDFDQEILRATGQAQRLVDSLQASRRSDSPEATPARADVDALSGLMREAKQLGYSDVQLATAWGTEPRTVRWLRNVLGIQPVYKLVDTCAAEFEAYTPYYYSTYETPTTQLSVGDNGRSGSGAARPTDSIDDEIRVTDKRKVIILGGGPNRIGQGIEFDYCCVHAVMAAKEEGYEAVMVNSNPETVSTDYDTSDLLFFEPLTHEDVLNICERLNGQPLTQDSGHRAARDESAKKDLLQGVIVQFGGQTPLNLAQGLKDSGAPIIGTPPESIHLAEDREEFAKILAELGLQQPPNGIAHGLEDARRVADHVGYPVLVRPSYVLGGRAMEICNTPGDLERYMRHALAATDRDIVGGKDHPILVDKFLLNATEVDVDCIADGQRCVVAGVMEHIEEAGIHSGDSACALPPYELSRAIVDQIKDQTSRLAMRLGVRGLMNVQYAVKEGQIYVLEVNPRASRTVPFVSKATGVAWAKLATKIMLGRTLDELLGEMGLDDAPQPRHTSVKAPVFPFNRFPGVDVILGPEMRSTGEVMGIDREFGGAFAKAQMASGYRLPTGGAAFISVNEADKPLIVPIARRLSEMGFRLLATSGTHTVLAEAGIEAERIGKIQDGASPNMLDLIEDGSVDLLINTPTRKGQATDEGHLRSAAIGHNRLLVTTITGARACVRAIAQLRQHGWKVAALQDYYVPAEAMVPAEIPVAEEAVRAAPSFGRRLLFRTVAVAASVLLSLGALELGLRWSGRVTDVPRYTWDREVGPVRQPNQSGVYIDHNVRVPYHFNAQGWNDTREYSPVKPAETTRVIVVGDSFVEALRVPNQERFVELAQAKMSGAGRVSQWYAFGCSGFGTAQEYRLIRSRVPDYNPDLVLLLFIVNDVYDSSPYLARIPRYVPAFSLTTDGRLQALPVVPFELPLWRRVLISSAIGRYALFHAGLVNLFVQADREGEMPREQFGPHRSIDEVSGGDLSERQRKSWELIEKLLSGMNDECRQRGTRFAVAWEGLQPKLTACWQKRAFEPIPRDRDPECLGERRYYMGEKLGPICKRHEIPYFDLTDAMLQRIEREGKRHDFPNDPHWNPLGHAAAGDALGPWVESLLQKEDK